MKRILICLLLMACLCPAAIAENDGDCIYTLADADGRPLATRAGRIYPGDEYISSDNTLYRVTSVDDEKCIAAAEEIGPSIADAAAFLLSDQASFITGQVLGVNGGFVI